MHAPTPSRPLGLGLSAPSMVPLAQTMPRRRNIPKPVFSCPPSPIGLGSTFSNDQRGNPSTLEIVCSGPSAAQDIGLQSFRRMEALQLAANGDSMIAFDSGYNISRFRESGRIAMDAITPGGGTFTHALRQDSEKPSMMMEQLPSSNTLLNIGPSRTKNAAGLKTLLGNSNARLKPKAKMMSSSGGPSVSRSLASDIISLEQAKQRARVEVDVVLESATCIQGGLLRGQIKVRVRSRSKKEHPVLLAEGKLRVVGFETIPTEADHHVFYQCAAPFSKITDTPHGLYATSSDLEGYAEAVEGIHTLPFAMELPLNSSFGSAKGVLNLNSGITVRYVTMISIRIKDAGSGKHSIAHFYRDCEVWPSLKLECILASAPRPLHASTVKSLSVLGGGSNDKVRLTANLHRLHWVAGQRCCVRVLVNNGSKKTIKHLTLGLIRTITIFKPKPGLDVGSEITTDPDACQTSTTHKLVAESILEVSQRGAQGHASAKGWWTGVKPGQDMEFAHHILLPPDALSISRGRLLEVEYSIRVNVSAGSLTSDVFVTLPVRIINFISVDSPPNSSSLSSNGTYSRGVKRSLREEISSNGSGLPASGQSSHVRQPALSVISHEPSAITLGVAYRSSDDPRPQLSGLVLGENHLSPRLQVTNPDPPTESELGADNEADIGPHIQEDGEIPIALQIQQSLSEASVYSTDSCLSNMSSHDSRLGNLDYPSDADSDAELTCMMGSVKIQQNHSGVEDQWEESDLTIEEDVDKDDIAQSSDEGYSSSRVSSESQDSGTYLEDVGRTNFASRVQEKLAARVQKTLIAIPDPIGTEIDLEEATPRVQYIAPNDDHGVTHDLLSSPTSASIDTTESVHPRTNLQRIPSSVRGPRGSRRLPVPPTSAIQTSFYEALCMPTSDSTVVNSQIRPSSDALRLTGESVSSVKKRIAALEERVKTAEDKGEAYF